MCPIKPWHCRSQPAFKAQMPTQFFQFLLDDWNKVWGLCKHKTSSHFILWQHENKSPSLDCIIFFNVKKDYCLCLNETTEVIMDVRHHHSEHPPPLQPWVCCHSYKLSLNPSDERSELNEATRWNVRAGVMVKWCDHTVLVYSQD